MVIKLTQYLGFIAFDTTHPLCPPLFEERGKITALAGTPRSPFPLKGKGTGDRVVSSLRAPPDSFPHRLRFLPYRTPETTPAGEFPETQYNFLSKVNSHIKKWEYSQFMEILWKVF